MKRAAAKRHPTPAQWVLCVLLCALLTACAGGVPSISRQSRTNAFESSISTYQKFIRWGYFEEALNYVRARDESPIENNLARIARYRVTGYNAINQMLADNGHEGRVVAMIEYYEIDTGVLHTLRDEQYWWYDEASKRWFLGGPLPAFGLSP